MSMTNPPTQSVHEQDIVDNFSSKIPMKLRSNITSYSQAVKQFDNCSPDQIQSVSKSFGKL